MATASQAFDRIRMYEDPRDLPALIRRENDLIAMARDGWLAPIEWVRLERTRADARGVDHRLALEVSADFLGFGEPSEPFRPGWMAATIQIVADLMDAWAPTPLVHAWILEAATVRLGMQPQGEPRVATSTMWRHHQAIETERAGRRGLLDGHFKTVVRAGDATHVAIVGGLWSPTGGPVHQHVSTVHDEAYADYSHGARLVRQTCELDGESTTFAEVLADPVLSALVSHDGPHTSPRLPQRAPRGLGSEGTPVVTYQGGGVGTLPSLVGVLASGASGAGRGAASTTARGVVMLGTALAIAGGVAAARRKGVI